MTMEELGVPCGLDYFKTTYGIISVIVSLVLSAIGVFWLERRDK